MTRTRIAVALALALSAGLAQAQPAPRAVNDGFGVFVYDALGMTPRLHLPVRRAAPATAQAVPASAAGARAADEAGTTTRQNEVPVVLTQKIQPPPRDLAPRAAAPAAGR